MSSQEEAYVGSSSSQIVTGKVKARHQKLEKSDPGQMNATNLEITIPQNVNNPVIDVDHPRKEKMRTVVEGGALRKKEPEPLQLVSAQPQPSTATESTYLCSFSLESYWLTDPLYRIVAKKERKGKGRALAEPMMQMDEQQATCSAAEHLFLQREPTSSMAQIVPLPAEGSSNVVIEKTRHPRKVKEPAAGEPKAKRLKLNAATTSNVGPDFVHENAQAVAPAPVPDVTTISVGALHVPPNGGAQTVKTKRGAEGPTTS